MKYVNLHVHSEFSTLDGAIKVPELARAAKEAGHDFLALTDHGSMAGSFKHKKACEANGIKPLYGCELFMIEDFSALKNHEIKQNNLHLTAIAKDQKGFELLMESQNFAHREGLGKSGRQKRPFIPYMWPLEKGWAGHVTILSGCANSPFWNLKNADGLELFGQYAEAFKDDFYGEMMPLHDWDVQVDLNQVAHEAAKAHGRKSVITNDIHYCKAQDWQLHELVICLSQYGMTWNNPRRWTFSTHQNFYRSAEDMTESMVKMGFDRDVAERAIATSNEIAEKCSFKLKPYPLNLPSPLPSGTDEIEYYTQACMDGLKRRGVDDKQEYFERLQKESELLVTKGFVPYMLLVADVIKWAKGSGIMVGPARGSVGGSLVSYLLGITEIDPIKHDLIFERFIAPDRINLPDIDIDIADHERHLVESYLKEKYGEWNVAHVSTYGTMLGRMALKDVSRVFEVPLHEVDNASKQIIKVHESEARAHKTIEDTLVNSNEFQSFNKAYPKVVELASKLEGQVRGMGVHAAGYVLSKTDLRDSNVCYLVEGRDGNFAVHWDKDDLEHFGLIKIDILGLSTLSVMEECLRLIERRTGKLLNLNEIPLDDKKVYETIGRGETAAIFQICTPSLTSYCRDLKPDTFEDLAALTALWRPGPIQAGMAVDYVAVRHGRKEPYYPCEEYKKVVEKTRGQIIYQEQIVSLLVELAGFSWADADTVRKIISKSEGMDKLKVYEKQFIAGCGQKATLDESQAQTLWQKLNGFGLYAFNKSHAVGYGTITYWTAFLKTHYPTEYLCAHLNYGATHKEVDDETTYLDVALREAIRMGITISPPDINNSMDSWTVGDSRKLQAGLKEVKFLGDKALAEIVRAKAANPSGFKNLADLITAVDRRAVNKRVVKSLLFSGAFRNMAGQWDLWRKNFDDLYESLDSPKKHLVAIEAAATKPEPTETPDDFLNYNEKGMTNLSKAGQSIVDLFGKDYELANGLEGAEILQKRDGQAWSLSSALRGSLPGFKGNVVREVSVKGLQDHKTNIWECTDCNLRQTCSRPVALDKGTLNVMIVAEAPGQAEDSKGKPLVGKSGQLLFEALGELGLDRSLFYIDNTVHCRPPNNKLPQPFTQYVDACKHLEESIHLVKPALILCLGGVAMYRFTKKESGIMSLCGTTEWNTEFNCYVSYCVHPASVLYSRGEQNGDARVKMFERGLKEFQRMLTTLIGENAYDNSSKARGF